MDDQLKYFCYLRKSTINKDRQSISIPAQQSELENYIREHKLAIVETLKEEFSAKLRGQRKIFNSMIDRIENGEANGILLWNVNRLSRNAGDTGVIIDLMDRGLLDEIRTPGQIFRASPQDKFLLNLFCGQAKLENDSKAVDVKRGLKKKAELGWRPANPIIGYKTVVDKYRGLIGIEPDPETFPIIESFFKRLASGKTNVSELYEEAINHYGLTCTTKKTLISKTAFYDIFRRPFYYGEFEWPANSGNWYKGKHQPMITRAEYLKVRNILDANIKPSVPSGVENLPYKRLFRCGECSMGITGSHVFKKQKSGKVHEYKFYHCTKKSKTKKCTQGSIRQNVVERKVKKLLSELWLPPEIVSWCLEKSREMLSEETDTREALLAPIHHKIHRLRKRQSALTDMRADGEIEPSEFREKKTVIQNQIAGLESQIIKLKRSTDDYLASLKVELDFANYASNRFKSGDHGVKRELIRQLGSNRKVIDRKLVIEPKEEILALLALRKKFESRIGRFKPISSLNKRTLDTMHAQSPFWRGRLY